MRTGRRRAQRLPRLIWATVVLCGSSYLLAHTVNAWMAASLVLPADPLMAPQIAADRFGTDLSFSKDLPQRMVEDIMAGRLFLLPATTARSGLATMSGTSSSSPPLNVSGKVALIGIMLGADGHHRAILEALSTRKQSLYRISQQVPEVGELAVIEKDRVLFRSGSQEEWLNHILVKPAASMSQRLSAPPLARRPTGRLVADRLQLAQLVSKPEYYLTEATFHPSVTRSGKIEGFVIAAIRPAGVLEHMGLQEDDILAAINGVKIGDPGKLWGMFRQLPQEHLVRLNVIRQGQPVTLTVEIRG